MDGQYPPGYTVRNDLLFYKQRLVLRPNSPTIPLILQEFHNNSMGAIMELLKSIKG